VGRDAGCAGWRRADPPAGAGAEEASQARSRKEGGTQEGCCEKDRRQKENRNEKAPCLQAQEGADRSEESFTQKSAGKEDTAQEGWQVGATFTPPVYRASKAKHPPRRLPRGMSFWSSGGRGQGRPGAIRAPRMRQPEQSIEAPSRSASRRRLCDKSHSDVKWVSASAEVLCG